MSDMIWTVVLILRTYAIWGKNIYVLIYLASFQFVSFNGSILSPLQSLTKHTFAKVFIVVIIFTFRQSVKSTTCA